MVEKLFVSYARTDAAVVNALVTDLRELGYEPFFDSDLTGGQRWWDTILDRIEESDVFLPVVSPHYLDSEACYRETTWAAGLGLAFLPIDIGGADPQLCQRAIAEANWVHYDLEGRSSIARLSNALRRIEPGPRPKSPPERPAIPMTYFGELEREISGPLSFKRQVVVLATLKSRLGTREDAQARRLLAELQRNEFISVTTWREIDSLLHGTADLPTDPRSESETRPGSQPDPVLGADAVQPHHLEIPDVGGVGLAEATLAPVRPEPALRADVDDPRSPVSDSPSGPGPTDPPTAEDRGGDGPTPWWRHKYVVSAAAAVVVAGIVTVVAVSTRDGDPSTANSPPDTTTSPITSTSATPEPTPSATELLAQSQPAGPWRLTSRYVSKTDRGGTTTKIDDDDDTAQWTFAGKACSATACTGTITRPGREPYTYTWDGKRLTVHGWNTVITDDKKACVDSSSGEAQPINESAYQFTWHYAYRPFTAAGANLHSTFVVRVSGDYFGRCKPNSETAAKYVGRLVLAPVDQS